MIEYSIATDAFISRDNGWWYISYSDGKRWGRRHYGPLPSLIRAWWRVKRGKQPQEGYKPFGEYL